MRCWGETIICSKLYVHVDGQSVNLSLTVLPHPKLFSHSYCHTFDFVVITLITLSPICHFLYSYTIHSVEQGNYKLREKWKAKGSMVQRVNKRSGRRPWESSVRTWPERGEMIQVSEERQLCVTRSPWNRYRNRLESGLDLKFNLFNCVPLI